MTAAARLVLERAGLPQVERFTHGTTVATNALLERNGACTTFVCTEGFEHLLHLRRQNRAHLYRLDVDHPEPLVPLERCFGVKERIGPDGVVAPLDLDSLPEVGGEAVAVCSSSRSGIRRHEARGRGGAPQAPPVRARRRVPRGRTGVPRVRARLDDGRRMPTSARWRRAYLRSLGGAAVAAGLPEPLVMRSSGGVATIDEAAAHRR